MNQPGRLIFHVPPIDMRGGDEIENELDEEFAFHLQQSARDLKNEGRSLTEAQREARARFGDIETIKRDCKRIAMKERIMLQRINLVLMIVVLMIVGLVSLQMAITQKYNTLALQAITADLAQMKFEAGDKSDKPAVFIEGDVDRPGVYALPTEGRLTLSRFFIAAGGLTSPTSHVKVFRNVDGRQAVVLDRTIDTPEDLVEDDIDLEPDDVIVVTASDTASTSPPTSPASNTASVLIDGAVERPGWYPIVTHDGATYLHELLIEAGVKEQMWVTLGGPGRGGPQLSDVLLETSSRFVMKEGHSIQVDAQLPDRLRRPMRDVIRRAMIGEWREISDDDARVVDGWELSVFDTEPVTGTLKKPGSDQLIDVSLSTGGIVMTDAETSSYRRAASWAGSVPETGRIKLDLSPVTRDGDSIRFARVEVEVDDEVNQPVSSLTIFGSVHGAGKYPFPESGELSVAEAIVMAGGPADAASTVEVKRQLDGKTQVAFTETFGTAGEMARMSFPLQPDDRVYLEPAYGYVPDEQPRVVGRVYLDGAVTRIGVYDLYSGKGKTLLELLLEGGGVTQTPARVQVVRHNDKSERIIVLDEVTEDIRQLDAAETVLQFEDHVVVSAVDTDDGG